MDIDGEEMRNQSGSSRLPQRHGHRKERTASLESSVKTILIQASASSSWSRCILQVMLDMNESDERRDVTNIDTSVSKSFIAIRGHKFVFCCEQLDMLSKQ